MAARTIAAPRTLTDSLAITDIDCAPDTVVGVIDRPAALGALRRALDAAAIAPERVSVLAGPHALRQLRARDTRDASSAWRRLAVALGWRTPLAPRYLRELEAGRLLVVVRGVRRQDAHAIRAAVVTLGGHDVRHYGRFSVATLAASPTPQLAGAGAGARSPVAGRGGGGGPTRSSSKSSVIPITLSG